MAYEKTNWIDNETLVDAQKLNKIEDKLAELDEAKGGTLRLGTNGGILISGYEVTIDVDGEVHEYTTVELNGANGGIVINGVELVIEI